MDETIDRLSAEPTQALFLTAFQLSGNLLRRPPFGEAVDNETFELFVSLQDGLTLTPRQIGTLGL